eukprot:3304180-Rhodomonas_salina.2
MMLQLPEVFNVAVYSLAATSPTKDLVLSVQTPEVGAQTEGGKPAELPFNPFQFFMFDYAQASDPKTKTKFYAWKSMLRHRGWRYQGEQPGVPEPSERRGERIARTTEERSRHGIERRETGLPPRPFSFAVVGALCAKPSTDLRRPAVIGGVLPRVQPGPQERGARVRRSLRPVLGVLGRLAGSQAQLEDG